MRALVRLVPSLPLILSVRRVSWRRHTVRAQSHTIAISGLVTDASGGVLPGAPVEAVVADRPVATAITTADGAYRLDVPAGVPLQLRVHLAGFAAQVMTIAGASQSITRNVTLPIGSVSDSLIVTAARNAASRASVTESVSAFARQRYRGARQRLARRRGPVRAGVNVESTGREGAVTSMFSRGGESDYNLVLIDGVRANQSGGIFDFSRINAAEIERVEVVRGAQSALWGSDAMGSVVQVFTRRAGAGDSPQLTSAVEAGSFDAMRADARLQRRRARGVDYHLGASHRDTDGAFEDLLPEDDEFEQDAVDGGVGAVLGSRATLRASLRYTKAAGPLGRADRRTARATPAPPTRPSDLSGHVDFTHAHRIAVVGSATYNDFRYESRSADTDWRSGRLGIYAMLDRHAERAVSRTARGWCA